MTSKLFSFWSGGEIGYVERLCIASMLHAGHSLDVYSYDLDLRLPAGVRLRDARDILPQSRVVLHESGSWALFSDIFRYEALAREAGTWIDLDMVLLKPITGLSDHVYGWQDPYVINGAILRLPSQSPCLQQLIALCRAKVVVAPQWSFHKKLQQRLRSLAGAQVPIEKLEWGVIGPIALTRMLADFQMLHRCQPVDVFYPVPWQEAWRFFEPDIAAVDRTLTSHTIGVHLWNDRIKDLKRTPPPPGSFVAKMCKRFDVEI
jgi:hypothetical protein